MANEINRRRTFAVIDELGVDPLRDKSIDAILAIEDFNWFEVDQSCEFNLPLIADLHYSDANLWWVILIYNGITDAFYVTRGTRLRMPNVAELTNRLSDVNLRVDNPRIISI